MNLTLDDRTKTLDELLRAYARETNLTYCPSSVSHGDRVQVILLASILKELMSIKQVLEAQR